MKLSKLLLIAFGVLFTLFACTETPPVPKPSTYLKTEFPEHSYRQYMSPGAYQFDLADLYQPKSFELAKQNYSVQEIDLGPLNGSLFLYYLKIPSKDSLPEIINFANDKVDEHKIMAEKIDFEQIIAPKKRVYGTFFELKGNVATNFQFYLTDSTQHFIRGEVLLNCRPNYDSLRPTLQYLKTDLQQLIKNFRWRQ
jgi:gliding motility-associated lipoprotein GldD